MPMQPLHLRTATPRDVPVVLDFIQQLSVYEKLRHEAVATEGDLQAALFGERPAAEVVLAYLGERPVGFALFFQTFSTFVGKPGMHLEDLFVVPEARGQGVGKALLVHLARLSVARGYGRLEWSVLDWNAPAIAFYESLGAKPMDEWTVYRLSGDALEGVGGKGQ